MPAKKRSSGTTKRTSRTSNRPKRKGSGKVGSDPEAARKFAGKNDFGVPESGSERDRNYVSQETKANDRGAMQPRSEGEGTRVSGVGARESGPGSSSGGDVDTDIIGVGTGGSAVSQSGPDDRTDGPDMVRDDNRDFDGVHRAHNQRRGREIVRGDTVDHSGGDVSTTGEGQGAGAVTNPIVRDDDSFAGEINLSEAGGIDNSPSDNR